MEVIFSGIQPTGSLHLGNYLGAIKPWNKMIKKSPNSQFLFSIVDMHAITVFQHPEDLKHSILQTFATYLACGVNPLENKNVKIFKQSDVKEHTELAWILFCNTPLGWLDRMTQYKDKTKDNKERECLGLYSYPCLMAADILLYNTSVVPVGEDQKQHLELTRDIAARMNNLYKTELFKMPEISISDFKRVMSLKDGSKKMSKSESSDFSRINLTDGIDSISQKISKATTGTLESLEVKNLLKIYKEFAGFEYTYEGEIKFAHFKKELADLIIAELLPITQQVKIYMDDKPYIESLILKFGEEVSQIASSNMQRIKKIIGVK